MNTNKQPKETTTKKLTASFESITADKIYAHEIHLVDDTPQGRKINLSMDIH